MIDLNYRDQVPGIRNQDDEPVGKVILYVMPILLTLFTVMMAVMQ